MLGWKPQPINFNKYARKCKTHLFYKNAKTFLLLFAGSTTGGKKTRKPMENPKMACFRFL